MKKQKIDTERETDIDREREVEREREARKRERRTYPQAARKKKETVSNTKGGKPKSRAVAVFREEMGYTEIEPGSLFLVVSAFRLPVNADMFVKESETSFLDGSVRIDWDFGNSLCAVYVLEM